MLYGFTSKAIATIAIANAVLASALQIDVTKSVEKCEYRAKNGDEVSVLYTGKLADGTVFDTTDSRGRPIVFKLGTGRVIKGWDQGILDMCVGEQRTLYIPSELGYGLRNVGPIPANSDLIFDVELVDVSGKSRHTDEL
ncbi:FK506-binding protein 2 precursor [Metschnikowia bicuspidata var. bicuspidata NRRL YB-4993]|uniref:peptidylprolyl isomerase n=1 Tax=Metschnikowia bicuspidata var. bicuspidata NRRL YB-4993 TaxID=869754 RepID=A0A1A0H1X0_9ASCO|nr:FK506-binding protein 2 precursor [Metschnikowia bicuspidata var. bicuspidata NRRL YB-4993]OBA18029.1 FK506-binding protein 2 precursor [Metschnikowia bicuspidata var. bicuspidata NRRL YB-4993]